MTNTTPANGAIRAVIFDFDGLIVDSETPDYETWAWVFAEHGAELALDEWIACVGRPSAEWNPCDLLETCLGRPVDRAAIEAARHPRFRAAVDAQPPMAGVEAAIAAARGLGLRLAVASSATRDWVVHHLERVGLAPHFEAVHTVDDVARGKPEPDLFLLACETLGVAPAEAVVLEDSPNGLLAARRAGCRCVVVPNTVTRAFPFDGADLRLDSLADRPLPEWLAELAGAGGG
jgi:HAD superfamily hydrolase (TIGR01509 family)